MNQEFKFSLGDTVIIKVNDSRAIVEGLCIQAKQTEPQVQVKYVREDNGIETEWLYESEVRKEGEPEDIAF